MLKRGAMKVTISRPAVERVAAVCVLLFASLCGLAPHGAFAKDVQGRNWAGACTGCHGSEGRSDGVIPSIAGMEKAKFVRLMVGFRDGTQQGTLMNQLARGLNDEQIEKLADYFASREPSRGQGK